MLTPHACHARPFHFGSTPATEGDNGIKERERQSRLLLDTHTFLSVELPHVYILRNSLCITMTRLIGCSWRKPRPNKCDS